MKFLQLKNIIKASSQGFALKDISFSMKRRQKFVVAGETGSGKSTLIKIIAGLTQPDNGVVLFDGNRVEGPEEKLVPGHASIAYLSQQFELPKFLRVGQVLAYANTLPEEKSNELYDLCHVDHLLARKTDQLSGGEKQRIALARLLISSPSLLLLDEPFSHLDMEHKATLKGVLEKIGKSLDITFILVSHDPGDTLPWADQIIVLRNGLMIQRGTPEEIYFKPVNVYVGGLFGKFNMIPAGDKFLFLRPEQLLLSNEDSAKPGVVNRVRFYGSHLELEVSTADGNYYVRQDRPLSRKGDKVKLFWQEEHGVLLNE